MIYTYMIELTWPTDQDPIQDSLHSGRHCLFYNPEFNKNLIRYQQHLDTLSDWANNLIDQHGPAGFLNNPKNYYDIANLVKLNMWVQNIKQQGIVKPMLLWYFGSGNYSSATGESRLRALERIPSITTVSAFISTEQAHQAEFSNLESITTLTRFAKICQAVAGQKFLFRLGDPDGPYGIDWFEYDSNRTAKVTPGESWCVSTISNYLDQHPATVFTPSWFDQPINWDLYKSS